MIVLVTCSGLTSIPLKGRQFSNSSFLSFPLTPSSIASSSTAIFIADSSNIHLYNPLSNSLSLIHSSESPISFLLAANDSLLYSSRNSIHIFNLTHTRLTQQISSHDAPISSIALSSDSTLLASTSSTLVHIHNLTLNSTPPTILHLPSAANITTSLFHSHAPTTLLIAAGTHLFVFDITKPHAQPRRITVEGGDIAAVACSPFSKSLVSVATCGGYVGLVDLDKEKPLFRNIPLKTPLTSLVFSPEGARLFAGTEQGKLLVLDLRALEKEPVVVPVGGHNGERVIGMIIMKMTTKPGETGAKSKQPVQSEPSNPVRKATIAPSSKSAPSKQTTAKSVVTVPPKPGPTSRPITTRTGTTKPMPTITVTTAAKPTSTPPKSKNTSPKSTPSPVPTNPRAKPAPKPTSKGRSAVQAGSPVPRVNSGVPSGVGQSTAGMGAVPARAVLGAGGVSSGESVSAASAPRARRAGELVGGGRGIRVGVGEHNLKVLEPVRDPLGNAVSSGASADAKPNGAKVDTKKVEKDRLHSTDARLGTRTKTGLNSKGDNVLSAGTGIGMELELESISTAVRGVRAETNAKAHSQDDVGDTGEDVCLPTGALRLRSRAESYTSARSGARSSASMHSAGSRILTTRSAHSASAESESESGLRTGSESGRELGSSVSGRADITVRAGGKRFAEKATAGSRAPATHAQTLSGRSQQQTVSSSRTPSPDLPAMDGNLDTPVPVEKRRVGKALATGAGMGMGVLGMGTPEVERWIEAGKGRDGRREREGKRVGFKEGSESEDGDGDGDEDEDERKEEEEARERSMTVQISPRRPGDPSPSPPTGAHLLRTIVRDVMYDMQCETRAGLTGLHLDLLRAGRGWKRELRAVMEEGGYGPGGEVERLREENRRLREENERLRRGW